MNILLIFPGFIIAFVIVLYYERKIRRAEPRNKVHFYVARDEDGTLYLYISKPIREKSCFSNSYHGDKLVPGKFFGFYGLKTEDFKDLKWEDEPVEVFLNLKD